MTQKNSAALARIERLIRIQIPEDQNNRLILELINDLLDKVRSDAYSEGHSDALYYQSRGE